MFTKSFLLLKTRLVAIFALTLLCGGMLFTAPTVGAATQAELQAMIAQLMAQIAALNGGTPTQPTVPTVEVFAVGSSVQPTANVRVRSIANTTGVVLGTVTPGAIGTVLAGPVTQGGVSWYRVSFKTDLTGWVSGTWLTKASNPLSESEKGVTFKLSDNNPDSTTIVVDGNTEATVLAYEIEATGGEEGSGDIEFGQLAVNFVINGDGARFDAIVDDVYLRIDGEQYNDVTLSQIGAITVAKFDIDGELYIEIGETVEVEVVVLFKESLAVDARLQASVDDYARQLTMAEAEDKITNFKGLAIGAIHSIVQEMDGAYLEITDTQATITKNTATNSEAGEFKIMFEVTAVDNDIYLSGVPNGLDYVGRPFSEDSFVNFSIVRGDGRVLDGYKLEGYTTSLDTTADDIVSGPGTIYFISEGETEEFTFTVKYKPATGMAGSYRVQLEGPLRYSFDKSFYDDKPNETVDINEKESQTPSLNLIGGSNSAAKIDSFSVTPQKINTNDPAPVTFNWVSSGTSYCYITSVHNSVKNNLGLSDLKSKGTISYTIGDKYKSGDIVEFVLTCQDASTQKDKTVEARTKVSFEAGALNVSITNISIGANPVISGNSEERVSAVGISISGQYGDKVYGSGLIKTVNGKWSHKVTETLKNGKYTVSVYVDNKFVASRTFEVKESVSETKSTPRFNGLTYPVGTGKAAVSAVFAAPTVPRVVTGPVNLGTINWGDGTGVIKVNGLATGAQVTVELKHEYKKAGVYTITLTDLDGKTVSEKVTVTLLGAVIYPNKNAFGCNRTIATPLTNGSLACYGMWDYGESFGGDVSMCGSYGEGKTGCTIKTSICTSGQAKATVYHAKGAFAGEKLMTISKLLKVSEDSVKGGVAGLWEYRCIAPVVNEPSCTLTASPASIVAGQSTKIMWTSKNATGTAQINQGVGNINLSKAAGSITVAPIKTTMYTLSAQGDTGAKISCSVAVIVTPASASNLSSSTASGQVLGASTDILSEISGTLSAISASLGSYVAK